MAIDPKILLTWQKYARPLLERDGEVIPLFPPISLLPLSSTGAGSNRQHSSLSTPAPSLSLEPEYPAATFGFEGACPDCGGQGYYEEDVVVYPGDIESRQYPCCLCETKGWC